MTYDLSVGRARDPLVAITIFASICIITTALRLKSRQMRKLALGLDDFLMLAALVSYSVHYTALNYAHDSLALPLHIDRNTVRM